MKGVKFGESHSYDDLHLILNNHTIETPLPRVEKVSVPNRDGDLDFSEYFGDVKYQNRKLTFEFTNTETKADYHEFYSDLQDKLHGRSMKVILDSDPDFYYQGRVTVEPWKNEKGIGKVTVVCDCEPYKYKLNETVVTEYLCGKNLWNVERQKEFNSNKIVIVEKDGRTCFGTAEGFTGFNRTTILDFDPYEQYTISCDVFNARDFCFVFQYDDGTSSVTKVGKQDEWSHLTLTSIKGKKLVDVRFSDNGYLINTRKKTFFDINTMQIEKGSIATEYEPFKVVSPKSVTLTNLRKMVVPKVKTNAALSIKFLNNTVSVDSAGSFLFPEFKLNEGDTAVELSSENGAIVSFMYQERRL